jgi:uncharacterized membrane protein
MPNAMFEVNLFWVAISAVCFASFMVIVVALAMFIWRRSMGRTGPDTTPPRDPALDALRTRLAKGEIDDLEFERLRSVMRIH